MKLIATLEETDYLTASVLDDRQVRLYNPHGPIPRCILLNCYMI
ncbi:MAG: hypothetical protein ACI3ZI_02940 [Candidatus Cryptobacteroides sp.]